jgi:predicted GNAT family acetyltransferase
MSIVTDNETARRFELEDDGHTAFATYRRADNIVTVPHVESPMELRGKGSAGRLMEGIAALARANGFKIVPTCPYAVAWFRRHPEAADVLT